MVLTSNKVGTLRRPRRWRDTPIWWRDMLSLLGWGSGRHSRWCILCPLWLERGLRQDLRSTRPCIAGRAGWSRGRRWWGWWWGVFWGSWRRPGSLSSSGRPRPSGSGREVIRRWLRSFWRSVGSTWRDPERSELPWHFGVGWFIWWRLAERGQGGGLLLWLDALGSRPLLPQRYTYQHRAWVCVSETLEDLAEAGEVLLPGGGEDDNVIQVKEAGLPVETGEDAVHEYGEGGGSDAKAKGYLITLK